MTSAAVQSKVVRGMYVPAVAVPETLPKVGKPGGEAACFPGSLRQLV